MNEKRVKRVPYVKPELKDNGRFLAIAKEHGIEVTPEILGFAEDLIRSCSAEARRSQDWNEVMALKLNIDQCILCEFDLPRNKGGDEPGDYSAYKSKQKKG